MDSLETNSSFANIPPNKAIFLLTSCMMIARAFVKSLRMLAVTY